MVASIGGMPSAIPTGMAPRSSTTGNIAVRITIILDFIIPSTLDILLSAPYIIKISATLLGYPHIIFTYKRI
jgi:hypothetical protein